MKLVFQIAGGIILAGLILFVGNATVAFFAAKALTETIQETQIEQARIYKQRQMQLDAQEIGRASCRERVCLYV